MIAFDTPYIWVILCAVAAATLSGILYWHKSFTDLPKNMVWILAGIRTIAIFLILILFLNIFFIRNISGSSLPLIICATDNSRSMVLSSDSSEVKEFFKKSLPSLTNSLQKNFTLNSILFGEDISENDSVSFSENSTNISSVFSYIDKMYEKTDVNAVVMFSDGINNVGATPSFLAQDLSYPVFVVATGDTTSKSDIAINKIRYNKTVFLQGKCIFEVNLHAVNSNDENVILQVYDNGKLLMTKNITIDKNPFYSTFNINILPENSGKHFYKFEVLTKSDDFIPENNIKTCIVDVIEGKKNVIIVTNGATPDIGAIASAVANNDLVETKTVLFDKLILDDIDNSDIMILCNLPDASSKSKLLFDKINNENIPYLIIVGTKTDIGVFNNLINDAKINSYNKTFDEAYPIYNEAFKAFSTSDIDAEIFSSFTPLNAPFGIYEIPQLSDILFFQRIGNVSTSRPMIVVAKDYNRRSAFIFGEGIWQWRIRNYIQKGNFDAFDAIINNMLYYLSLSETFQHFQVDIDNEYYQDEPIRVSGKLYNDNYELYNTPDIQLNIKNENNEDYPFYLSRSDDNTYYLDIENFPTGQYSWKAISPTETLEGAFYISSSDPEHYDLQAKHDELRKISSLTGGGFVLLKDASSIPELLKSTSKDIKTFVYKEHKKPKDYLPLLLTIIALLSAEWILRRRYGIY